jgi:membrane protease YdiL (CAAX protease family)
MQQNQFLCSWWWSFCSCILIIIIAVIFWEIFLVQYIYEHLKLPLGLGGAVYPALFAVPVLAGAAVWQIFINNKLKNESNLKRIILTVVVPSAIAMLLLFIFCPTDTESSLPRLLLEKYK